MSTLFLRLGHVGKRSSEDMGASFDVDGDGKKSLDEREALFAIEYAGGILTRVASKQKNVLLMARGDYSEDWAYVNAYARNNPAEEVLYVACHLDVGSKQSRTFYDSRSVLGASAAKKIAAALEGAFKGSRKSEAVSCNAGSWNRAYNCIQGVYSGPFNVAAVLLEPLSGEELSALAAKAGMDTRCFLAAMGAYIGQGIVDFFERTSP